MNTKQVIVIRKDLNMRKGKMVAQGAHASLKALFDEGYIMDCNDNVIGCPVQIIPLKTPAVVDWIKNEFTKICVSVNSEEDLHEIYRQAREAKLLCSLILDAGHTEFNEPTYTAVAVGPGEASEVDKITGHLKLL